MENISSYSSSDRPGPFLNAGQAQPSLSIPPKGILKRIRIEENDEEEARPKKRANLSKRIKFAGECDDPRGPITDLHTYLVTDEPRALHTKCTKIKREEIYQYLTVLGPKEPKSLEKIASNFEEIKEVVDGCNYKTLSARFPAVVACLLVGHLKDSIRWENVRHKIVTLFLDCNQLNGTRKFLLEFTDKLLELTNEDQSNFDPKYSDHYLYIMDFLKQDAKIQKALKFFLFKQMITSIFNNTKKPDHGIHKPNIGAMIETFFEAHFDTNVRKTPIIDKAIALADRRKNLWIEHFVTEYQQLLDDETLSEEEINRSIDDYERELSKEMKEEQLEQADLMTTFISEVFKKYNSSLMHKYMLAGVSIPEFNTLKS